MKKIASTLCGVMLAGLLALPFVSCTNQEIVPTQEITELRFNVQVTNASAPDTKVLKTAWEVGDKMFVFFNVTDGAADLGFINPKKYVTLTYNGTTWDGAMSGSLTNANELGTAGKMFGIYFPFGGVNVVSDGFTGVNFTTSGNTVTVLNGQPIYTYYLTGSDMPYTVTTKGSIATLNGSFEMTMPDGFVYFFVNTDGDKYNANEKYRLSITGISPAACTSYSDGVFTETTVDAGGILWGYTYGTAGIAFSGKADASWSSSSPHKFLFFADGDPAMKRTIVGTLDVSGHQHPSVRLLSPNTTNGWSLAMKTPTYALMGDGKKWGDRNVGASSIDDEGIQFRYGEIIAPLGEYVNFTEDASYEIYNKYPLFDAARAWLGANWRTPSKSEFATMLSGCYDSSGYDHKKSSGTVTGGSFTVPGYVYQSKTGDQNSLLFPTSNVKGYWTASSAAAYRQAPYYWMGTLGLMSSTGESGNKSKAYAIRPIYIGE